MQLYFVVDHVVYLTCHIHFLGIQFALNTQVYTVKMQVIRVINFNWLHDVHNFSLDIKVSFIFFYVIHIILISY